MVKHLTDLGMGKKESMEDAIWLDAQQIHERVAAQEGKPMQCKVRKTL